MPAPCRSVATSIPFFFSCRTRSQVKGKAALGGSVESGGLAKIVYWSQIASSSSRGVLDGSRNPSLINLLKVAGALGVGVEELLSRPRSQTSLIPADKPDACRLPWTTMMLFQGRSPLQGHILSAQVRRLSSRPHQSNSVGNAGFSLWLKTSAICSAVVRRSDKAGKRSREKKAPAVVSAVG